MNQLYAILLQLLQWAIYILLVPWRCPCCGQIILVSKGWDQSMGSVGVQGKENGWYPGGMTLQTGELIPGVGGLTGESVLTLEAYKQP